MGAPKLPKPKEDGSKTLLSSSDTAVNVENPSRTRHQVQCKLIITSLGVLVVFLMVLGVFTIYKLELPTNLPEFCTECRKLDNETMKKFPGTKKHLHGEEFCCVGCKDEYKTLMEQLLNKPKTQSEKYTEILEKKDQDMYEFKNETVTLLHNTAVAAHVLVGSQNSTHFPLPTAIKDMPATKVLQVYPYRSLTLLRGVRLVNDSLIIPSDGTYLIYSQIYFKVIRHTNWPDGFKLLCHIVERYNRRLPNKGRQTLIQSVYTLPEKAKHPNLMFDFHTSYISGVTNLMKGDAVYVRATKQDVVGRRPTLNYIGLVKLG